MTRREALALVAAASATRLRAAEPRPTPALCLFSEIMPKIEYAELGGIVKQFGFDGIDLTVRPGGHVDPRLANVDLVRAFESIDGAGLEYPMVTTAVISPFDNTALPVVALSGMTQVPLFVPGFWTPAAVAPMRELATLVGFGARYHIGMALHNHLGENSGEAAWSASAAVAQLDPRWSGLFFDPIHSGENWEAGLKQSLPRLKAVALKDFKVKDKQATPCPMGEGVVDWQRFFGILSQNAFFGPLSMRVEYKPKDEIAAVTKDYEFTRKALNAAYVRMGSGSGAGSGSGPGWGAGTGSGGNAASNF